MNFDKWRCFIRESTVRKGYYNQYSPLGSELKKQTDIAKHQYKFFKDQMNIINNNREDGVKAEDGFKTEDVLRKSPPMSPGRSLKILFDHPGDVSIWRSREVPKWRPGDMP